MENQGIKSLITIPLIVNDKCLGFVGFDSVKQHYHYSDKEKKLLDVYAQMLVNVRNRKLSSELIDAQINDQSRFCTRLY